MLKAFIYDQTGRDSGSFRRDVLQLRLAELQVEAKQWTGGNIASTDGGEVLVLAHSSDLSTHQDDELEKAARKGAMIVFYTAGAVQEYDGDAEHDRVLVMEWKALLRVLEQVPDNFDLAAFRRSVETTRNRGVLTALAILSWCTTFPAKDNEVRRRQKEWRNDQSKWLRVFNGVTREEFVKAFGVGSISSLPGELTEVGRVLVWLWSAGDVDHKPSVPDFSKALKELQSQFGIRV